MVFKKGVYKRDNYECKNCGLKMSIFRKGFHIHHIIPFLKTRDNSLENLITLCQSCHSKIEIRKIRKDKEMKK